jgi:hypothetical protein
VGSGLLKLHTFQGNTVEGMLSMTAEGFTVEAAVEDILWEYVERASIAMEGDGYPRFDDLIGRLVGESARDGLIDPSPAAIHRGRHEIVCDSDHGWTASRRVLTMPQKATVWCSQRTPTIYTS